MIIARRTEGVHKGVQSDTSSPSNSKMSAIKILFLICGVFAII